MLGRHNEQNEVNTAVSRVLQRVTDFRYEMMVREHVLHPGRFVPLRSHRAALSCRGGGGGGGGGGSRGRGPAAGRVPLSCV